MGHHHECWKRNGDVLCVRGAELQLVKSAASLDLVGPSRAKGLLCSGEERQSKQSCARDPSPLADVDEMDGLCAPRLSLLPVDPVSLGQQSVDNTPRSRTSFI